MSEAFKQTRSYLRWELVKLFVLNQVLGQLIKERRVANHMNVLCAQFFEYLLNLVYGFDESWVVNSFFDSFNNSQWVCVTIGSPKDRDKLGKVEVFQFHRERCHWEFLVHYTVVKHWKLDFFDIATRAKCNEVGIEFQVKQVVAPVESAYYLLLEKSDFIWLLASLKRRYCDCAINLWAILAKLGVSHRFSFFGYKSFDVVENYYWVRRFPVVKLVFLVITTISTLRFGLLGERLWLGQLHFDVRAAFATTRLRGLVFCWKKSHSALQCWHTSWHLLRQA